MTLPLTARRRLLHPQPTYAPPQIPIRSFPRVTGALPPRAWWLFAAGLVCGWLLHAFTH